MPMIVQIAPDGDPEEVTSCPFDDEKELGQVLADHPRLLQGGDVDEFVFVDKEISLPSAGEIDLLMVSSEGLPIIVEVKLIKNREIRREIVAQIFDYVSDLTLLDLYELDDLVDGKLQKIMDDMSEKSQSQDLWKDFTSNLRTARTQFILAVEDAPESLLRIVQFLCRHTNLNIKLVQIQKFKNKSGEVFFVPTVMLERGTEGAEPVARDGLQCREYEALYEGIKENFRPSAAKGYVPVCLRQAETCV
jgi:hypothetical protein